jgi:predicted glycoside hydrolase/deacetylase ChbG (UPF0249 family)
MGVLERLGFSSDDRLIVVHVDDIGMSAAANRGALDALDGLATCGSIMVPCPAFGEIAAIARERPDLDLGVHLTLNAEYASYRWGPLRDDVPGLRCADGGMWRTTAETVEHASVEEVERELRAQIDRAVETGIDVTHLDSHMGTVMHPKFAAVYARLGRDYRLPIFLPRIDASILESAGVSHGIALYVQLIDDMEADGFPVFDHFCADSLRFEPGTGLAHNTKRLERLGPGLSYLITHAAQGGDELAAITADWRARDEERRIYSDGSMARVLDTRGVRTIGMRHLRDLIRTDPGPAPAGAVSSGIR